MTAVDKFCTIQVDRSKNATQDPQADPKAVLVATVRQTYMEGKVVVCFASHPKWHGIFDPDLLNYDSPTFTCSVSMMARPHRRMPIHS